MDWSFRFWSTPPPLPPPPQMTIYQWAAAILNVKSDTRAGQKFMMSSPVYPASVCIFYSVMCLYIGPKMLSKSHTCKRKTHVELIWNLRIFNACRILLHGYLGVLLTNFAYIRSGYSLFCQPFDTGGRNFEEKQNADKIIHYMWAFYVAKVIDLLDVFFFIALNKGVSGLQVYHHTSALTLAWLGVKFFPAVFPIICNCFNGVIVYIIHLVNKISPPEKQININSVFASMLLIQLGCIFCHSCVGFWLDCGYPRSISAAMISYAFSFLLMAIMSNRNQSRSSDLDKSNNSNAMK